MVLCLFFFKQKTAYECRISDWSSDVCSSDLIKLGLQDRLYLGNLDAKRDWGHARDYVDGMWRIVQRPDPDDYVLATGEAHSVREFVETAFDEVGKRSEEHPSGLLSLMRNSSAVFCLNNSKTIQTG